MGWLESVELPLALPGWRNSWTSGFLGPAVVGDGVVSLVDLAKSHGPFGEEEEPGAQV
jgi:hypothetical protein